MMALPMIKRPVLPVLLSLAGSCGILSSEENKTAPISREEQSIHGWSVRIDCRTRLTATAPAFQFTRDLEAFENDAPFAARRWTLSIPRKLV